MINTLLVAISEEQLRSSLRHDLPLLILGSIIAAIGVAAIVVQLCELNESGLLLGVRPGEEYSQTEFTLETGDRLLIYTDGLVEAVNALGHPFGEARLGDFIRTHRDVPAEPFAARLLDEVLGWPENSSLPTQADDITLVVIDIGEMPQHIP